MPFIALPTTAGTGSEETDFAVVYSNKLKYSIMIENLKPNLSLIDPYFTKSTSKYLSASAGFDALTQSIESYWSINSSKESREISEKSITIILNFLKEFIFKNEKSRLQMASLQSIWQGNKPYENNCTTRIIISNNAIIEYPSWPCSSFNI